MAWDHLTVEPVDNYAVVTLNRPKANAMSTDLVREIRRAVQDLDADPAVRCILITGTGNRFFSAGADIPELQATLPDAFAEGGLLPEGLRMVEAVEHSRTPVVGVANGTAVGGGCELLLACHFRIASETARFGQPEINLGIIPGWGGCHRLPRLIGESRALDWLVTGRLVTAEEAFQAGFLCKTAPPDQLMQEAGEFASFLASRPPVALQAILRCVRERGLHPERGATLEAEGFAEAASTKDATEGVAAYIEKRKPNFIGE
jgi:enoyl-CoA hydratase